jgi:glutathione S-transferase
MRLTALTWVPEIAQGLVREIRVRWALEEAGLPYEEVLLAHSELKTDDYRDEWQPFGQVPAAEEDGLALFESGALVLRIAERSPALLPTDPAGRARAICWMFAALNSVEPQVENLAMIDLFYPDEEWAKLRRPGAEEMANKRLAAVARRLDGRDYLEDRFTAGDLLMTTVLRNLRHTDMVARYPALKAYQERCETRPAFQRAVRDHMAVFGRVAA